VWSHPHARCPANSRGELLQHRWLGREQHRAGWTSQRSVGVGVLARASHWR